jgi:hypothetical protein
MLRSPAKTCFSAISSVPWRIAKFMEVNICLGVATEQDAPALRFTATASAP